MTTIVCDSKMGYMAADRCATSNDCEVACEYPKIRVIEKDDGVHFLATSGYEGSGQIFEEWYEYEFKEDGEFSFSEPLEDMEENDKFTTVILKPNCEIWVADHFYRPYRVHSRWYCTGTGGPFAWAILRAGCGIEKAMSTAIEMDPHSGFGYDIERLEDYE